MNKFLSRKNIRSLGIGVILIVPVLVFAQSFTPPPLSASGPAFGDVVSGFFDIINMTIPIIAAMTLLVFFWGLTKFIAKAGDPRAKEEGRTLMVWGVIALFVMISIWGIIAFLSGNFPGFDSGTAMPLLPTS